ncbi:hypothetical protein KAR91_44355, partial [Candidatus Pacearchaeota archaeon]|nr:hypothetical protein [Candidatus Pacearchaeota archaeon]
MMNKQVLIVVLFLCFTSTSFATASFQGLGDLAGGNFESKAYAISGNGKVVVGSSSSSTSNRNQAFIWTADNGMQGLDYLTGSQRTSARDVSFNGSIVVGWSGYLDDNPNAFKWTESGGITNLGGSRANAISDNGSVIAGSIYDHAPNEAVRWTEPVGMVGLGGREVYGISADGSVAVGVDGYTSEMEAVYWNVSGDMISLGLGGTYESARAASSDGTVIVGSGSFGLNSYGQVFRWVLGEGWHLIESLPNSTHCYALDVSSDGTIVVGTNLISGGGSDAFIWDEINGTRNLQDLLANFYGLNLTGWDLEGVSGIAADNITLVGYGINPDGNREAWLATLPEDPMPPAANANPDQTVSDIDANGSEQVTLDGSASTDSDGDIVSWVWTDESGNIIADGEIVTVNLSVGVHTITLTVTDDGGLTDSDTVVITVEAPAEANAIATWMSGSDMKDAMGVYGTKGVADPANIPGARRSSSSWTDSASNLWLFGGLGYAREGGFRFLGDLWKYDGENWTWVTGSDTGNNKGVYGTKGVADPTNDPGARVGGISWTDSSDNFWLFGGNGYGNAGYSNGLLNDIWKYDGQNWTWVSGSGKFYSHGVYGTKGVADPANIPGARGGSAYWTDSDDNLWLFGGSGYTSTNSQGVLSDLWKYDGENWTWISGANTLSTKGVYGTKGVADPANTPGARSSSAYWTGSAGDFWLFGGIGFDSAGSIGHLNDLWKYDGSRWTWVCGSDTVESYGIYGTKGIGDTANVPGARVASSSWTDSAGNLWLFGGYGFTIEGNEGHLNDLWKYDGENWTWVIGADTVGNYGVYGTKGVADPANIPGARFASIFWANRENNLWLFGGYGRDGGGRSGQLNDLWKIEVYEYNFNTAPVADAGDDITVYAGADGTARLKLDGSGSYDADAGDVLSYYWFNDADELIAEGKDPNVILTAGVHVIELVVDDGTVSSEPNSVVVTVVEAKEAKAYVFPRVLNAASRGR